MTRREASTDNGSTKPEGGGPEGGGPKTGGTSVKTVTVGEILAPVPPAEESRREARIRSGFFATVRRAMRHIPFMEDVAASYYCALDPATPSASKGILLAALAYFVMPFDIVPDFLLGLGFTDDVAVLLAAVQAVRMNIRPEHYDRAREALSEIEADAGR